MIYDIVQPISPPEPSVSVQAANIAAVGVPITPTNAALASTTPTQSAPPQGAVPQLPSYITNMLVSQQAVTTSRLSATQRKNLGVLQSVSGVTYGQLSQPGQVMKPGSGAFLQALQQQAGNLPFTRLASKTLMTGQYGVTTPQALLSNVAAQTGAINSSIQSATIGLKNSGVLTGNELPTQVSGIVLAGATLGVAKVTELLRSPEAVAGKIIDGANSFGSIVASGNFAGMLADKVSTGMQGVQAGLEGLTAGLTNKVMGFFGGVGAALSKAQSLVNAQIQNLTSIAQKAFNTAEQSFGELKSGSVNVLGPVGNSPAATQLSQKLGGLTEQSSLLQQKLADAKANLAKFGTTQALAEVSAAENALSTVKQQIAQVSSNFLSVNPATAITDKLNTVVGTTIGDLSAQARSLFSTSSAQDVKSLANSVTSGKFGLPTTENSGLNAIPGGLGSFSTTLSGAADNAIQSLKTAASNLGDTVSGALGVFKDPGKLVGDLVGNAQAAFTNLASNVTSSITQGIGSITSSLSNPSELIGNFAGAALGKIFGGFGKAKANLASIGNEPSQIKPATLVADTFKATKAITAKTGALLGDTKIPQPTFGDPPVVFDVSSYQREQDAALAEINKLSESRDTKLLKLATAQANYNDTNQPSFLSEMTSLRTEITAIDKQITTAQTRYTNLVTSA